MTSDDRYYITDVPPETPAPADQPAALDGDHGRRQAAAAHRRLRARERRGHVHGGRAAAGHALWRRSFAAPHAHAKVKKIDTGKAAEDARRRGGDHGQDARRRHPLVQHPHRPAQPPVRPALPLRGRRGGGGRGGDALPGVGRGPRDRGGVRGAAVRRDDGRRAEAGRRRHPSRPGTASGEVSRYSRGDVEAGFAAADASSSRRTRRPARFTRPPRPMRPWPSGKAAG